MSSLSIATAKEVFDLLRDDLAAIEQEFLSQSASKVEVITDIAQYLMAGGGKRIRPLLLLGALLILAGIQFFSMGFIGEFLTYQNHKRRAKDLPIREELR